MKHWLSIPGLVLAVLLLLGVVYPACPGAIDLTPFFDFYSDNHLSAAACGRGYTGIATANDLSGVVLNPASLEIAGRRQFYLEYVHKSKLPWLPQWGLDLSLNTRNPVPLIGIGTRLGDHVQTGLLYYTSNSYRFDLGENHRIDPEGNFLGTYHAYTDFEATSLALPAVVEVGDGTSLKLGINLRYAAYGSWDDWGFSAGEGMGFHCFVPVGGLLLRAARRVSIGATYMPEIRRSFIPTLRNEFGRRQSGSSHPAVVPSRMGVGIFADLSPSPLSLAVDYRVINASASVDSNLVDRRDLHAGIECEVSSSLTLRMGFFTQPDYRDPKEQWLDRVGLYNQVFLTFGGSYTRGPVRFEGAVMDSHWLSNSSIEQTSVHVGVQYNQ